jgi:predicted ester cyclase
MRPTPDELTREWFEQVWNGGDETAIDRLLAPDAKVHGLGGPMVGPDGFKPMWRTFRAAFADLHVTVERTFVDGDICVAQCRVRGRHAGDALGGPATGREIEIEGVTITRSKGDQLVEGWNVFDFLGMYQQIGWIPNPVLPAAGVG